MSESVPRGNRPAEELRNRINVGAEYPEGRREIQGLIDAALRAERLAGRQEAVADILERTSAFGQGGWVGKEWLLRALDEVGVAGLTEEAGS